MARTKRVLIAGLYHETHTFVPGRTALADFSILRGQDLLRAAGDTSPLGGTLEAAHACGWTIVPAIDYRAIPSGTVEDEVLEAWWEEFRQSAEAALQAGPLEALFLVLHGAMVAAHCRDVEGKLLARIRAMPGLEGLPIGGVTDLHANVGEDMARMSSALVTYRRNPHTDARETAVRAVHLLNSLIETGRAAQTAWRKAPLVLAPTATGTDDEPMRTLETLARQMEAANPDILAVNVHAGFAFADTPDTGVSFTACTIGDAAVAGALLDELVHAAMNTPSGSQCDEIPLDVAMARLAEYETGPILLVEPSDNIGAGAPGEGVALLRALVAHKIENAGVIVNDPDAVAALADLAQGERRTLAIGGKGSPLYGGSCTLEVELLSRSDGSFTLEDPHSHMASMLGSHVAMGPCALVQHGGVIVLLTSRATAPFDLAQWRSQGVAPEQLFAIGVKAAVAHRQAYNPIARATLYVNTPGPCSSDLRALPFRYIRRPVRPLDEVLPMTAQNSDTPSADIFTAVITLRSGEEVTLRLLRAGDAAALGAYFESLSAATRARYGPHPFDQATADAICAGIRTDDVLRIVAALPSNDGERLIAYFLLKRGVWDDDRKRYEALGIPLQSETDATLAPSVADAYQDQGLGSLLMRHALQAARHLGRKRVVLWGGVQATNDRAVHFYTKAGFRKVGDFYTDKPNYDMILYLSEES